MRLLCLAALIGVTACSQAPGGSATSAGSGNGAEPAPPPVVVSDGIPTQLTPPTFAGTWGVDLAQCKTAQDAEGAPIILSEKGYDQYETHCNFSKVDPLGGGVWNVTAACTVQGSEQPDQFSLKLAGDSLTVDRGTHTTELMRCP